MSSDSAETNLDLIDFHVGPQSLPRRASISEIAFDDNNVNLIDTELPVFEQKLLTQSGATTRSRRNSVDVEDILINIDSDEYERDSLDGEEVETDDFLNVCDRGSDTTTTLPADNFEALLVLKNLDDLLNATLDESKNGNQDIDDDTQFVIEECLGDLDNYLQTYDSESISSSDDQSFNNYQSEDAEFDEETARAKLRQIEENYRKFVTSGIINRGFIDSENNDRVTPDDHWRRPASACAIPTQLLDRKRDLKASTVNGARRERPRIIRRKSLNENYAAPPSSALGRTSGTDALTVPLSDDVTRERHAHASADCCTGTVVVESARQESASSSTVIDEIVPSGSEGGRSPWLRTSMRRLQQVELPNVDAPPDIVVTVENDGESDHRGEDLRPVSAPSRLPPLMATNDRSSRSRSRDNVSQQPDGGTRSSSASSRSRRGRSASSSGTSLDSSVDSTMSRVPRASHPGNNAESAAPETRRRWWWLSVLLRLFTVCLPRRRSLA